MRRVQSVFQRTVKDRTYTVAWPGTTEKGMKTVKLVIFDCDGVMFDSRRANRRYYNHVLAHFGHPPMDSAELDYVHVHNVFDSVAHIFRNYDHDPEAVNRFREKLGYNDFLKYMTMEPDLLQFLDFLLPKRMAAISTNRTTTMEPILDTFKLRHYFDQIMTPLNLEQPKPHPEAINRILAHYDLDQDEAVYIGDSDIDEEHAKAAGVRFIAFRNPVLNADFHVASFREVMGLPIFSNSKHSSLTSNKKK